MATEQFTQVNLGVVFTPLNLAHGLIVTGNVAAMQNYDLSSGQYTPNYANTHLVVSPWLEVKDPDGIIPDGSAVIANGKWSAVSDGVVTPISGGGDYAIGADYSLSVKRNVTAGKSLLLRFEGEYLDTRTGDLFSWMDTIPVRCEVTEVAPVLTLDAPSLVPYSPVFLTAAERDYKIRAYFKMGKEPVDPANYLLVWEKRDPGDTAYHEIGSSLMDYDVVLSADKTELTVKREYMGSGIDIRVRAKYDPYGNPSSVALDDTSPTAQTTLRRMLPTPTPVALAIQRFRPGQTSTQPECRVYVGRREVTDPEQWWLINWYLSANNAAGTVTNGSVIGSGAKPVIPLSKMSQAYGGTAVIGVKEREPLKAATYDGKILTYNGKVLLIHPN